MSEEEAPQPTRYEARWTLILSGRSEEEILIPVVYCKYTECLLYCYNVNQQTNTIR